MKIIKGLIGAIMAMALALSAVAASAQTPPAPTTWTWNLTGQDTGHGTFTTAGDGSSWTDILTWGGVFDGFAIGGLLPTNADPANWAVDDKIKNGGGYFTNGGVLFSVPGLNVNGGHNVNIFTDNGSLVVGTGTYAGGYHLGTGTFTATPVPEPELASLMLAGLAAVGLSARRRKVAGDQRQLALVA